jgi:hypothetical protein
MRKKLKSYCIEKIFWTFQYLVLIISYFNTPW